MQHDTVRQAQARPTSWWAPPACDVNRAPWLAIRRGEVEPGDFADTCTTDVGEEALVTQVTGFALTGRTVTLVRTPITKAGRALYYDALELHRDAIGAQADSMEAAARIDAWCQITFDPAHDVVP